MSRPRTWFCFDRNADADQPQSTGDLVDSLEGEALQSKFFSELENVLEKIHPGSTKILNIQQ